MSLHAMEELTNRTEPVLASDGKLHIANYVWDTTGLSWIRATPASGGGGGGGDASAANQVIGNNTLTSINSKLGYKSLDFAPGYTASTESNQIPGIDVRGSLVTRGAVLTDEGTFRVNFANTSLAVSIGTVSISGAVVTGSGFLSSDVHYKDYFKLDSDLESAWVGIESIDSDTQLTLIAPYVGGSSGAASRALMQPVTGSGGSITVASGQATITSGVDVNSISRIFRDMDYAPLVFRTRFAVSQRIVNQTIRAGLSETRTLTDRWFARFKIDGTIATSLICESGRNPTTTPSVAETESTTITIPNGLTTASQLEYRVEQLTESIRFYINGVLVAEHTKALPAPYDQMEGSITCINGGTAPASSTSIVIDYVTSKNHNKLEIGVMSDSEKLVSTNTPLQTFTFTQAGVIALNTIVLGPIDCSLFRSLQIHCVSIGTTGALTVEWSGDGINWNSPVNLVSATALQVTLTSGQQYRVECFAKFFRIRVSTATTGGTTNIVVNASQSPAPSVMQALGSLGISAGSARIGSVQSAGIYYDDSATALAASASFTGSSRDLTATASGTAINSTASYYKELRVSAESDQSGTLWLEVSRDNTNWRRVKSVATAAVTGGAQYAEIVHMPSTRYARVGFTNGATLQTRFFINSILLAA